MNKLELFKSFSPKLDLVYKNSSCTSILDGANELVQQGANANEILIPRISMDGLGNYDRNSGYADGDVTMDFETKKCNFDRGRMFNIDDMDNVETMGLAFGSLSSEFIRTKVTPELDAFRLSSYATYDTYNVTASDLDTGEKLRNALSKAMTAMDENEVPIDMRYLFITPTLYQTILDMDTTKSKEVLKRFAGIVQIPQSRFYMEIEQRSGKGEYKAGGFIRKPGANNLNFMILYKGALIQFAKRVAPKIVTPEQNQNADAWKYGYRNVSIAEVYEEKKKGIYVHKSTITA